MIWAPYGPCDQRSGHPLAQVSWHIKWIVTESQEVAIGWWDSSPLKFTLRQHKSMHLLVTHALIWHMGDGHWDGIKGLAHYCHTLQNQPLSGPWIHWLTLSSVEDSGGFSRRNSVEDPKPFILFEVVDLTGRPVMASDRPIPSHTHCHDCCPGQIKRQGASNPAVKPHGDGGWGRESQKGKMDLLIAYKIHNESQSVFVKILGRLWCFWTIQKWFVDP